MNETLIDALSGIADAIRAKGVEGTMNAWEMPQKIANIPTGGGSKYGITLDGILGDVDANGELQRGGEPFSFSSSEITSIPAYYFDRAFFRKNIQSIDLPNLTTIGTQTFINSASQSSLSSVSMPELSAIPDFGLQYAFRHCSALESVDLDSVQTVGESGLQGCCFDDPALVRFNAPSISSVGKGGMYRCLSGCTSLEEVCLSSLTSAGNQGLDECFMGCTSLKKVQMPLSYAGTNALRGTFNGCSALEEVDFSEATSVPTLSNINCFANTNETYRIVVPDSLYDDWITSGNWSDQSVLPHITTRYSCQGLTFTSEEANSTVAMQAFRSAPSVSLEYTIDNGSTWSDFIVSSTDVEGTTVTLANVGDKMVIRAKTTNSGMGSGESNYNYFVMTGKIAASGSIMYLLKSDGDLDTISSNWCFRRLFYNCSSLTQAPELPATSLADYCYIDLFYNCTSLTQAPDLPATALSSLCYASMFYGCTSLTTAPELPATTMVDGCYRYMFYNCTSLVNAPELPATTLAGYCYCNMFQNCTSLTTAPELPATRLVDFCYASMFYNCSSLNSIKIGYAGNFFGSGVPTNAFNNWVNGVAASGTLYYDGNDTTTGNSAIPTGWSVVQF